MFRREFLTGMGSMAFLGPLTTPDGRQDDLGREDGYPVPPDHITDIRADLDELRAYQPKLYYDHLGYAEQTEAQSDVRGMFGWTAESSKYDVTAHYYWVRSNTQRSALYYLGIDANFLDSHYTDHEPIIVFVAEDGTVDSVATSGGHHYVLPIEGGVGHFTEDRVEGEETHINLLVVRPHNHFMHAPLGVEGTFVQDFGAEFGSWLDQRETWYDNGRYHSTSYEAVEDPFSFYAGNADPRQYWWREDTRDAWFARTIYIPLGLTQGDSRDELRFEE